MREGDDVFAPVRTTPANVLINGKPFPWRLGLTVAEVLRERGTDDEWIATAVNTRFVPRGARPETPLWPDDRLVVFSAVVGG
jgi:sulfur carrier protein